MRDATVAGSVLLLRPKLMTVTVVTASLIPIMWSHDVGAGVMKPIAAPTETRAVAARKAPVCFVVGGSVAAIALVMSVLAV